MNSDRVTLLKNSNFNTVRRFAQAHPDKLMTVMGCSLNELQALENAQRKAAALAPEIFYDFCGREKR